MIILGIETSCDETAAAVVDGPRRVLANVVHSQVPFHKPFGGVVPEVAAREHAERLPAMVSEAVRSARVAWTDIGAVAVTAGPGLATSLLVGVAAAQALAIRLRVPLLAVHHLDAHLQSVFFDPAFPSEPTPDRGLVLLVSGGHTCLVRTRAAEPERELVGTTLDDAAGEALDKGARLLGLGYPGGPAIEAAASGGDPERVPFPRGELSAEDAGEAGALPGRLCFSFSGLKTSLLYYLRTPGAAGLADVAASYQEAVVDALILRIRRAVRLGRPGFLGCAGGVARNRRLREKLAAECRALEVPLFLSPPEHCTDNAAMVAAAAAAGRALTCNPPEALDIRPSWPLPTGRALSAADAG